jgi:hypothetical protein
MSAPIKQDENSKTNSQDPLLYAPPWARAQAACQDLKRSNAPPTAARPDGSKLNWPPPPSKLNRFEGDIAMSEMRRRLSLDPDLVPEPPARMRRGPAALSLLTRLPLYIGLAAVVAYAVVEFNFAYGDHSIAPGSDQSPAKASRMIVTPAGVLPVATARLVVEDRQALADEPLPLGVELVGSTGGESVFLNGLVKGTRLSAGEPFSSTGWHVPARELGNLLAYAPSSFVGAMDAEIELRSANNAHLDIQVGRLEWIAKSADKRSTLERLLDPRGAAQPDPAAATVASAQLARLIKRGLEFIKDGDIAASRLVLRRAADAGNAQAALMLGATFDPNVLAELGVVGLAGNRTTARAWYQKAMEFGSAEASRRIDRLAQTDK